MGKVLVVNVNLAIDKTVVVDDFIKGRVYRFPAVKTLAGGKGVNVSRALETFGLSSRIIGFIAGHNGRWIEESLDREGFDAVCVPFSPGESRLCYSIADRKSGLATDLNEEGFRIPVSAKNKFIKEFTRALAGADAVAFCGRIAPGLEKDFFVKLIEIAKRRGKPTAIDTSGAPLRAAFKAGPTLFKMNREEFREAFGEDLSEDSIARFFDKVSAKGTEYAVVTDGPNASYAVTPENLWKIYPPRIHVVTPIGAGDSFMAGLIYGFCKGFSRQECARIAVGAAASDCLSLGAGIIDRRQCMDFAQKAVMKRFRLVKKKRSGKSRMAAVPC